MSEIVEKLNQIPSLDKFSGYFITPPLSDKVWVGGRMNLECGILVAAFNHLLMTDFIKDIANFPWQELETVQLFIKGQEDEHFWEALSWYKEDERLKKEAEQEEYEA